MTVSLGSGTVVRRILAASAFTALLVYAQFPTRQAYPGQTRVRLNIRTAGGSPAGARLRVLDNGGAYFAPLGHLSQPDPTRRMSGDVILGDGDTSLLELHAYVYDGTEIDLPPGRYTFHLRKGFEYAPLAQSVTINQAPAQTVDLTLRKFADFEANGWYPGDTHMHFPDPSGVRYEMECEGLRVCSLLLLKSGYRSGRPGDGHLQNVEHFAGRRLQPVSDARYFIKTGEEFRHGLLAHLIFQNLKNIVWPVSVGGLREGGVGGFDWPMMFHATADAHDQGALVTWAHWPYPSLEAPLDIALGRIDSLDLLTTGSPFEHHPILTGIYKMQGPKVYSLAPIDVYYHYLNCGFHLSASAGSDKMALNPPMGSSRTYAKTDGPLNYDSWIEGIRRGRSFATTYPLLEFTVNDALPGDTIKAEGKIRLSVKAKAQSIEAYDVLEVIYNGKVVASARPTGKFHEASITQMIEPQTGGWIALRAWGRNMLPYGATWWQQPVFAHTTPVYIDAGTRKAPAAESAALFLDQLGYLRKFVEQANMPTPAARAEALDRVTEAETIYRRLR